MRRIAILGATGSIGKSTLDVIARHPDRFEAYALTANTSAKELADLCRQFRPRLACIADAAAESALRRLLRDAGLATEVLSGPESLIEAATRADVDSVVASIVGAAGLSSSLAAARAGKRILLANKEALVMAGPIFMDAVRTGGATLLPIDSEHNAIFQCLPPGSGPGFKATGVTKVLLTASGGPFRLRERATLHGITPDEACAHPNWVMGRKISVDSATMMNKGLEIIEAHWLFGATRSQIEVVIHPQSVIHSMVEYADASVIAQLGNPDMRTPIAHVLAYPERIDSGVRSLDLATIGTLTFEKPDFEQFPALRIAYDALEQGGTAPAVMNAANEVAVAAFLERRLPFLQITSIIEETLSQVGALPLRSLEDVHAADFAARERAAKLISNARLIVA
jgi:1-deoxy-D-xylulose-5-phosphate reductoisomerase